MCVAGVHNQKKITPCHPRIKPFQLLEKDDLCHPGLRVASILASKAVLVDVFETARVFVFANDKKWKLVRAISIATHSQRETLFVLFASFKLLCGQGIVRLLRCHVLVKISRWFGSGHTVSCCTYLHSVKQSNFIHVVDVTPLILIQSQTNMRQALFNHSHVDWSKLPKAAVGLDAAAIFECLQPPIWELKGPVARVELGKEVRNLLFGEVTWHIDLVLVCEEPPVQSCLHQWVLHGPLPLCRLVHILLLGKDFSRAFEHERNRSLTNRNVMRLLKPRDQICLCERWMFFLVLTKSYPNLVGHVRIGGPLWIHYVVVLVVAAVVVVGCCYPNVNATVRKCYKWHERRII